ncbi:hypothetical protein WJX74_002120 [Apatococcus lobatus]|uniref:Cyclase n=1 Tax=Apatococcus lobatus TaxID=904363 RepID=A0AAW1RBZ3_9CHLO
MHTHLATHLDAPSHFLQDHLESGRGVEALDLTALNGPALVIQVPSGSNITDEVMQGLHLPKGIKRLILKTDNTARGLMHQTPFHSDYTAMDSSGAEWLVTNTEIKLIGIDYLSIAMFDDLTQTHEVLLQKLVIPVEGLVLDGVPEGIHNVHCLPLLLEGSDGAPCRCILM